VEGTTLPTAFIGAVQRDFTVFRDQSTKRFTIILLDLLPISSTAQQEDWQAMIELTRLNGKPMVLNSDLIKTAEASPDTMLTLINGEKLIVRETLGEVVDQTLAYRAKLLAAIARSLPVVENLMRAASITSLDVPGDFDRDSGARPGSVDRDR
jgi:flagellar protein FlbD